MQWLYLKPVKIENRAEKAYGWKGWEGNYRVQEKIFATHNGAVCEIK